MYRRVDEESPPSWRVALCSTTTRWVPSGRSDIPSKPWLFWRPVSGWSGSGFGAPGPGLFDEKCWRPWRIGMNASGGRIAVSIVAGGGKAVDLRPIFVTDDIPAVVQPHHRFGIEADMAVAGERPRRQPSPRWPHRLGVEARQRLTGGVGEQQRVDQRRLDAGLPPCRPAATQRRHAGVSAIASLLSRGR